MILVSYIVNTMFPLMCALVDSEHHLDGDYIEDHTSRVLQRGCFFILALVISPYSCVYSIAVFWVLFDGARNLLVGEDWLYIGTQAKTDKIASKNKRLYLWSKIFAFIVCVVVVWAESSNIAINEYINGEFLSKIIRIIKLYYG